MPEVIENPVINSPYHEPDRHFVFDDQGITNRIEAGRRTSTFFIPIAAPRHKEPQLQIDGLMTADRMRPNELINKIREEVQLWRQGGYRGVTPTTRRLLDHWKAADRDRPLFFCQIEAAETAIFIGEAASKLGVPWVDNTLKRIAREHTTELFRMAFKIATGGGKTIVMGMLIAWHALNKGAARQDRRFSDRFLLVTPGITVRDRLRVLKPSDPDNLYIGMDLVPPDVIDQMQTATVEITNFHAFLPREKMAAATLTKEILTRGRKKSALTETPEEVVNRVCRIFGSRKTDLIIINDEAHHCYHRKLEAEVEEKFSADEKKEVERDNKAAEVWISGLEAIDKKVGVKNVYDLSATPFFLQGSGYAEGTLFPWVVSDFALIDAIESGIVKVPRVPVADNRAGGKMPVFRDLWQNIKLELPKGTRTAADADTRRDIPDDLAAALLTLYEDYERTNQQWPLPNPPVFIVVCNNTRVSKLVFDYLSGYEVVVGDGTRLVPGSLKLFSNVTPDGQWKARPSSLLVDSVELESGDLTTDFRKAAARELEEFKADYRTRSGGKDPELVTDAELLREVLNTVGKPGKLGADIRCVVSVSMLAEGWDATTVTHVLGVRAFGTQLLCEQVVGRALRRFSYVPNDDGMFDPEYAEVYGVPFTFIPVAPGLSNQPKIERIPNHVNTLPDRSEYLIQYPRVTGYRFDVDGAHLDAAFDQSHVMTLTAQDVVTKVECDPIVGLGEVHTLEQLRAVRTQTMAFGLARRLLEDHFRDEDGHPRAWLVPQLVRICKRWLDEGYLRCSSETYPQLVMLPGQCGRAASRIHQAIVKTSSGRTETRPVFAEGKPIGSTESVEFDTLKPVVNTRRCHLNRLVVDSGWEEKVGQVLDQLPEVAAWVKNDRLGPDRKGLRIPYSDNGRQAEYVPDFIVRIKGKPDWNLLVEVTGERREAKLVKAGTALNLWLPAVNGWGGLGQWDYLEIHDPYMSMDEIGAKIAAGVRG